MAFPSLAWLVLVILLLWKCSHSYKLIDDISGTVNGGETNYYTLKQKSITLICLISDEGDADLYIDHTSVTKTPNFDTHKYSATSVGLDVVPVMYDANEDDVLSIGVHGYTSHEQSKYRLYIVSPSDSDIRGHQIWELDPETETLALIIDVDPLWMANDPKLHQLLEMLSIGNYIVDQDFDSTAVSNLEMIKDWLVWITVNAIYILIEILA